MDEEKSGTVQERVEDGRMFNGSGVKVGSVGKAGFSGGGKCWCGERFNWYVDGFLRENFLEEWLLVLLPTVTAMNRNGSKKKEETTGLQSTEETAINCI
jgi:hypothetical protein